MKRSLTIVSAVFILLALVIGGGALAYFSHEQGFEKTKFQTGEVKVGVSEGTDLSPSDSNYLVNRQVGWTIENQGTSDVRLRVAVRDDWEGEDGKITLTPTNESWMEGGDGYYYHSGPDPLKVEESIDFNLNVAFDTWEPIENYDVDIEVEAVQAVDDAVNYMWPDYPKGNN